MPCVITLDMELWCRKGQASLLGTLSTCGLLRPAGLNLQHVSSQRQGPPACCACPLPSGQVGLLLLTPDILRKISLTRPSLSPMLDCPSYHMPFFHANRSKFNLSLGHVQRCNNLLHNPVLTLTLHWQGDCTRLVRLFTSLLAAIHELHWKACSIDRRLCALVLRIARAP